MQWESEEVSEAVGQRGSGTARQWDSEAVGQCYSETVRQCYSETLRQQDNVAKMQWLRGGGDETIGQGGRGQ
jgi:hypothetical protein